MEDPDAPSGTFRHWAIYNIPPSRPKSQRAQTSRHEKTNDFGNERYDGREPPVGHGPHRYFFKIAALREPSLSVPSAAGIDEIWREAQQHIVDEAQLIGIYERA